MSTIKKYFEKKVSLLSTSDVRYDGQLYTVDPAEKSIALKHVNCMGTEGRRDGDQAIAPSDCTYEFIIFRAVNIRELWLDQGNNRKKDLTEEVLNPLRNGRTMYGFTGKPDSYEPQDVHPKRKVGYGGRSQGYGDPYYRQPPHDPYYQQYRSSEPAYPQYPPQAPPQGGYYNNYGGYQQRSYNNRGYQQRRQPQYYNQQRQPYYQGGYDRRGGGYYQRDQNQGRRYPYQYNRNNYHNNRGYNRGYQQQRQNRYPRDRDQSGVKAGTGAFLDSRRLRGDEIDVKDQQDFDFDAAKEKFDQDKDAQNVVEPTNPLTAVPTEAPAEEIPAPAEEVKEKEDKDKAKTKTYDSSKSFFDGLQTETKRSKPKQDLSQQKEVDAATFGTVGATYRSRHMQRQQRRFGQGGQNRNWNNRDFSTRRRPQQESQQQQQNYNSFTTNKWVPRQ